MFLRKRGRRILLLHSYRDGRGRVCQARLGHFEEAEEALRCLRDQVWQEEFARRHPEVKVDWGRFLEQAGQLPENSPKASSPRPVRIRLEEALSTFLRLLAQVDDPQLTRQIADVVRDRLKLAESCQGDEAELEASEWRLRSELEPRRSQFWDGTADAYLKTLSRRAEALQKQSRHEEACQVLEELAHSRPTGDHLADYGAALQVLGRSQEAMAEYERIPRDNALRYYNLASLHCKEGRMEEALRQLMNGMLRDRNVAEAVKCLREGRPPLRGQEYWERFGHLWDPIGRWFMLGTYSQPLVRTRLTRAAAEKVVPRELVKGRARRLLLQRVLYWDPPKRQVVARRKRSQTASQSGP